MLRSSSASRPLWLNVRARSRRTPVPQPIPRSSSAKLALPPPASASRFRAHPRTTRSPASSTLSVGSEGPPAPPQLLDRPSPRNASRALNSALNLRCLAISRPFLEPTANTLANRLHLRAPDSRLRKALVTRSIVMMEGLTAAWGLSAGFTQLVKLS